MPKRRSKSPLPKDERWIGPKVSDGAPTEIPGQLRAAYLAIRADLEKARGCAPTCAEVCAEMLATCDLPQYLREPLEAICGAATDGWDAGCPLQYLEIMEAAEGNR